MADAERWAAALGDPAYAIDDDTAVKVVDGAVEVVSEGNWKLFAPSPAPSRSSRRYARGAGTKPSTLPTA